MHGDRWDDTVKPRVEAAKNVQDQITFLDRRAENVDELLHLGAVAEDCHVALVHVAKLGADVDGSCFGVVEEDGSDSAPQGVCRVLPGLNDAQDLSGDGEVHPQDNSNVVLDPVGVVTSRGAVDVVHETELGEDDREHLPP